MSHHATCVRVNHLSLPGAWKAINRGLPRTAAKNALCGQFCAVKNNVLADSVSWVRIMLEKQKRRCAVDLVVTRNHRSKSVPFDNGSGCVFYLSNY